MKLFLKYTTILIVLLSSYGCVVIGGGYVTTTSKSGSFKNRTPIPKRSDTRFVVEGIYFGPQSYSEIKERYGSPSKIVNLGPGREQWVYKYSNMWNGVYLFPVLPLPMPIMIPVGHETILFTFENDKTTEWSVIEDEKCGFLVGIMLVGRGETFSESGCDKKRLFFIP
jgi:hypothetical protein